MNGKTSLPTDINEAISPITKIIKIIGFSLIDFNEGLGTL
jgi:hypothetical protein